MYKFLMVDDEDLIRSGLRDTINWHALGFEFLEPCADGFRALSVVARERPDVVMTDIRMPKMNGLELTEVITRDFPHIKLIVLSGHNEFDYARTALRHGVVDYLLKPVTSEELTEFLRHVRASLDQTLATKEKETLREILTGTMPSDRALNLDGWPPEGASAPWCVARVDGFRGSLGDEPWDLSELEEILGHRSVPRPFLAEWTSEPGGAGHADLVFWGPDPDRLRLTAYRHTHAVLTQVRHHGRRAMATIAAPVFGVPRLAQAARDVARARSLRFFRPEVFQSGPLVLPLTGQTGSLDHVVVRLGQLVREGDRHAIDGLVDDLRSALGTSPPPLSRVTEELGALFSVVPVDHESTLTELFETFTDRDDLLANLRARIDQRLDSLGAGGSERSQLVLQGFRRAIHAHFQDPDLSLEPLSRELHVSPSYLSKLLRQRLATSFSRYLREVRISKAKELLSSTNLTTDQIAERSGFHEYRYFSHLFKLETGTPPSQYRHRARASL